MKKRRRRWGLRICAGVLLAAVIGVSGSAVMFARWTRVKTLTATELSSEVTRSLSESGSQDPYVTISADGTVSVDRELEQARPVPLSTLHVLTWQAADERRVQIDFPFWFVRLKMTESLNLGTLTTALAGDWDNLDLRVSERDLHRRGPGLVLDHTTPAGDRVVIWSSD